jgi:basic amino acid/polyamine antiporter, APA family
MLFLPAMTWWRFVLWSLIGVALYLVYGLRHSKMRVPETKASSPA